MSLFYVREFKEETANDCWWSMTVWSILVSPRAYDPLIIAIEQRVEKELEEEEEEKRFRGGG